MSLQIWLPLLTDIYNQGLYNIDGIIPSSNSSSFVTSGKLGTGSMSGTLAWHLSEDILNNAWSVATWIKSDGSFISGNNIIFCKNISNATSSVQIYFSIIDGTQLNIGINGTNSSLTSNYSFSEGNWYHVAATYDGNIATLYVNGEKLTSKSVSGTKPSSALNIRINGRSTNAGNTSVSNNNTNFQFNDFRLYDHALSSKEVEEIAKGLMLHYKLDNNGLGAMATTVYDCSGYFNNGTIIGELTTTAGSPRYDVATVFDGVTSGILIENLQLSNIINTAVTYSFWIKPIEENGGRSVYFGSYSGVSWSIEKGTNNKLRLYWNGSPDEICSTVTITDEEWQHIVIIKNGINDVKVYLNGEQTWTSTATHNNLTFPTIYSIARDTRSADGTPYHGQMSDFRIYATALTAKQVKELYDTSVSIDSSGNIYARELVES